MAGAKKTPRARRRAKTLARIVDTGLRLVTEGGFDALTMQRLADELDYAAGAVYRYFPSKDALLLAVQMKVLELLAEDLAAASERVDAHLSRAKVPEAQAPLLHLVAMARVYATLPLRRPAHAALLGRWLGLPELLVETEQASARVPQLLALFADVPRRFAEAAASGALSEGDPMRRTVALWSALQGAMQLRKLERFEVEAVRYVPLTDELLRALFVGWGADEHAYADLAARAARIVPDRDVEDAS